MCGIAGFILSAKTGLASTSKTLSDMTDAIRHRGPDDGGGWYDEDCRIALGHRRLSILDLSDAGHQPMRSASGRYIMVYNGEVYNHLEIRADLEQNQVLQWIGHSDTETLLAAIDAWGIRTAFERSSGMFAAAIWDRQQRELTLVRDRLGEKPLYYGWCGGNFLFASELKALRAFPGFAPAIDQDALGLYMAFNCVPAPWSIYQNIRKLMPGTLLTLKAGHELNESAVREDAYWSLLAATQAPRFSGSPEDAAAELERLLSRAISMQRIADVPLGCFLSGGIDSSLVTALMQRQANQPVKTFAIGFDEKAFDETPYAAAVARHLGTDHTSLILSPAEALKVVHGIPDIWDEPFADASQIPTACVAALARRQVTVSLSGDGGDELFAGYSRYTAARKFERLPAKWALGRMLDAAPLGLIAAGARHFAMRGVTERRLRRLASVLKGTSRERRYLNWLAYWPQPDLIVPGARQLPNDVTTFHVPPERDDVTAISALDAATYLPNDILTKVDRAAMAVSLETRVPLLDHNIVEFAYSLPIGHKVRNGQSKWPLRHVLGKYVPHTLTDRPKKGFSSPITKWLRGPLREWAGDLLTRDSLQGSGLDSDTVIGLWNNLQSNAFAPTTEPQIWSVLMYQAWRMRHSRTG